jgi:ATP-dependent DNA helicase RecG
MNCDDLIEFLHKGEDSKQQFKININSIDQLADELETEAGFSDFDIPFFETFYKEYYKEEIEKLDIPIDKLLENIKLLKNGHLTLSGLMLCGKSPERFRPQFGIKATYFEGIDISSRSYKDSQEIRGKLIQQYQNAIFFIKRNLRRVQKDRNVNAPGILEIPEEAFTEIVANAIVHRNYYISAPIQIYLFDDRLEINSPGSLPNTITEENIRFGIHVERNPITLYFLEKDPEFRYSGKGSGIPRVIKSCDRAAVTVRFTNDKERQQFRVTFFRA